MEQQATHHLEGSAQHPAQDIREPELVLSSSIVRQFDKVRQRILVKYEGELLVVACPIRHVGRDVEEDLEADLQGIRPVSDCT